MHHKFKDLTGQVFGMLTALRPTRSTKGSWHWQYQCRCGRLVEKLGADVTKDSRLGRVQNCGCMTAQLIGEKNRRHGLSRHPLYIVWRNMLYRCYKPWHEAYKNYGGRGITVSEPWHTFETFYADMAGAYKPGLTLERKDNNAGYSKENCCWATYAQQAQNTRATLRVVNIPELSERTGIGRTTLYYRLKHGWSLERLGDPPGSRYMT